MALGRRLKKRREITERRGRMRVRGTKWREECSEELRAEMREEGRAEGGHAVVRKEAGCGGESRGA